MYFCFIVAQYEAKVNEKGVHRTLITNILGVAESHRCDYNNIKGKGGEGMEWIRISMNKLKIMLSAKDAQRYALSPESANYADTLTRRAFRRILTEIREESGFDATEDKVYIQMYPSKEGGCELFVTKMGLLLAEECKKEAPPPRERAVSRSTLFVFAEMSALLSVCRRLESTHFSGKSQLWTDDGNRYWLFLTEKSPKTYDFIEEYGRALEADFGKYYLCEHGRLLCRENAVSLLAEC